MNAYTKQRYEKHINFIGIGIWMKLQKKHRKPKYKV